MMQTWTMGKDECDKFYTLVLREDDAEIQRALCRGDLYFLLSVALGRDDVRHCPEGRNNHWLYDRIREVEIEPDGCLDLWAREHYKSTIITFAKTIQDILKNPNSTFGIFSHTRGIAKGFLNQIKTEFEQNEYLLDLFPDVLWEKPKSQAKFWSDEKGIVVKRKGNPKESTVEAWGLVDGQPTSKHFTHLIYDDVVTLESVTTSDQINKVNAAWEMSLNLGAVGGVKRFIGTRYHARDTYQLMMDRGSVKPRIYAATDDGTPKGNPIFLTKELLDDKYRDYGPSTFSTQMLQSPWADKSKVFNKEDIRYYTYRKGMEKQWNLYLLCDPATKKSKTSDYVVIAVVGIGPDGNRYLLDGVRDRLKIHERTRLYIRLHRKWKPKRSGYEQYGMQCDVEYLEEVMDQQNYRFSVTVLGGNKLTKLDRIKWLEPVVAEHKFFVPYKLHYMDCEGEMHDFVDELVNEEMEFMPLSRHDDMCDCISRIEDPMLGAVAPRGFDEEEEGSVGVSMTVEEMLGG